MGNKPVKSKPGATGRRSFLRGLGTLGTAALTNQILFRVLDGAANLSSPDDVMAERKKDDGGARPVVTQRRSHYAGQVVAALSPRGLRDAFCELDTSGDKLALDKDFALNAAQRFYLSVPFTLLGNRHTQAQPSAWRCAFSAVGGDLSYSGLCRITRIMQERSNKQRRNNPGPGAEF